MAGTSRARTIREEKQFVEEKAKLKHTAKRLDEVLFGVTWALCRKPDSFPNVPGTKLYLAKTDGTADTSGLFIWFTFDAEVVYLLSIEEAANPE
jgi:hypothetical protein